MLFEIFGCKRMKYLKEKTFNQSITNGEDNFYITILFGFIKICVTLQGKAIELLEKLKRPIIAFRRHPKTVKRNFILWSDLYIWI